jgi:hypothetical protein
MKELFNSELIRISSNTDLDWEYWRHLRELTATHNHE